MKQEIDTWKGNWMKLGSFIWFNNTVERPEDCLHYSIRTRDTTDPIEEANARVFERIVESHPHNAWSERHTHWAAGWVDKIIIRVVSASGRPTEAFKEFLKMIDAMSNYPIIDEATYDEVYGEMGEFVDATDPTPPEGWRVIYNPFTYRHDDAPYKYLIPVDSEYPDERWEGLHE